MQSNIFYTDIYRDLQSKVLEYLNTRSDFLSTSTAKSTRAAGDGIEDLIKVKFEEILGDLCSSYSSDFTRRAMEDFAFEDKDGFKYAVDVKTHRTDASFSMPNLISAKRLSDFYENDLNYFALLLVSYTVIEKTKVVVSDIKFIPIEFLSWSCLTLGALGWGQIQIASSSRIDINPNTLRADWMTELCNRMIDFYPKEIEKINNRLSYFRKRQVIWTEKSK